MSARLPQSLSRTTRITPLPAGAGLAVGLLFLRVSSSALLLAVHGLPKLHDIAGELARIEDPFGFGPHFSLLVAIAAEVFCPPFLMLGLFTRVACLPVLAVLVVAMGVVHRGWSLAEGQFGWLLLICFISIALCGPGKFSLDAWLEVRHGKTQG